MGQIKIKVLIVDDSVFFREFMSRSLSADPLIEVVGIASSGFEAMEKTFALQPEIVVLDIEIPHMRGTDFLKQFSLRYPRIRVVVISSISKDVFAALQAGAVDFVLKPNTQSKLDITPFTRQLTDKIKIAAATAITKRTLAASPEAKSQALTGTMPVNPVFISPKSVIAIGASTGGTEAILAIVKDLPANTPGMVIVQHMPPMFTRMYAERLDKVCNMRVREAKNGDRVEPGLILIAEGGDKHMRLGKDARGYVVWCEPGEKISGHCPSVDALFESVAQVAGANAVGVLLTGMGADGAKSLLAMRKAGAYTIGQDQSTCVVYGMPMVAYNLGGVVDQLPLEAISEAIVRYLSRKK